VSGVYKAGPVIATGIETGMMLAGLSLPLLPGTPGPLALKVLWSLVLLFIGVPVTVVVHEAGHAWACLVLGVEVRAIRLGLEAPGRPRFTAGKFTVSLPVVTGLVEHGDARSAGRGALLAAAGPLANLIVAATLACAVAAARSANGYVLGLACLMAGVGVSSLMPSWSKSGGPSDGARVLAAAGGQFAEAVRVRDASEWRMLSEAPRALRAEYTEFLRSHDGPLQPERTTRWLAYFHEKETLAWAAAGFTGRALRREGRIPELLALHADLPMPAGPHVRRLTQVTHMLAWEVLLVPGLPPEAVDRAVSRVRWVLGNADFKPGEPGWYREAVQHTLALGRLRQGRYAEAEQLCRPILTLRNLPGDSRATVLATIALARQAQGQPHEQFLAEAITLARTADLVPEAAAATQFQPSSFRGPPDAVAFHHATQI
jgi:hypothetical protein